jgi:hypothetical protein
VVAKASRWIRDSLIVIALLSVVSAACSDDADSESARGDQRQLNSVMVGAYDELSAEDSAAVSAIGVELVALAAPLLAWFDGSGDRTALLDQMTASVDRIEARLTPDRGREVQTTFTPYVDAWRDLLAALAAGDTDVAEDTIDRLRSLDGIRIDRVVDVYGEEAARRLLADEGVDVGNR